jgi:hypothetical protein
LNLRPHPERKIARVATALAYESRLGRACPILIPRGGPRPWGSYQQNAGNRCAKRRSRRLELPRFRGHVGYAAGAGDGCWCS